MRTHLLWKLSLGVIAILLFGCPRSLQSQGIDIAQSELVNYSISQWSDVARGSHRAILEVPEELANRDAVRAYLPWRRRDSDPENKRLILIATKSGNIVENMVAVHIDRESLDLVFQPSGAGIYELYYLPHTVQPGSGSYQGDYLKPIATASPTWRESCHIKTDEIPSEKWKEIPQIPVLEIQARGEFERFDPMEVIAKDSERKEFTTKYADRKYLIFMEDRTRPIVMTRDLPLCWVQQGPKTQFAGTAQRNEYYAFQTGVFALQDNFENIQITYHNLIGPDGVTIPASAMTCFNLGGTDCRGQAFTKRIDVPAGCVQALWFGIDISQDAKPGKYEGALTISGDNQPPTDLRISLTVTDEVLVDRGDSEIWRHSRLRWLNSTLGTEDTVFSPFEPLQIVENNTSWNVSCLGRDLQFGNDGLPEQISCGDKTLLKSPVRMEFQKSDDLRYTMKPQKTFWTKKTDAKAIFVSEGILTSNAPEMNSSPLQYRTETRIEFDGHIMFKVELEASQTSETSQLQDISLVIPFDSERVPYLMGLGQAGGFRPKQADWKWGGTPYYDSFWLGDVHGGLQCELRGANYCGPMVNLYYRIGQLQPPETWNNNGAGGVKLSEDSNAVTVCVYSGKSDLTPNEKRTFEFAFLVTPVKPIDTAKQFQSRYYHNYATVDEAQETGANIINIHHANELNLYINYPFLTVDRMRKYVDEAHAKGMKVKIYYTVRELTNHVVEWAAMRSLGTEIFADGNGGGYPWCREHFVDHYTPQWYDRLSGDEVSAAVVSSGESRWYNYYIEGLKWMLLNLEIDGLYLDDVSYDREILQRMRRVMEQYRPGCMIDLHSNTGFSFNPANQYMEFLPYIDKTWFGESFNYNDSLPDYWLTEISTIPYGVMGEMLQNGGNPWRGMVYGITSRVPWSDQLHIVPKLWKLWDDFGIDQAEMIGYWESNAPVTTDVENILATTYVRRGQKTLVAIASWAPESKNVHLKIDWNSLGLTPENVEIIQPELIGSQATAENPELFQAGKTYQINDTISIDPGKGVLLIVSEK